MKYKSKWDPTYVQKLEEYLGDDSDPHFKNSFTSFSRVIGVTEPTLWAWLKSHPEFRAVKEKHARRKVS